MLKNVFLSYKKLRTDICYRLLHSRNINSQSYLCRSIQLLCTEFTTRGWKHNKIYFSHTQSQRPELNQLNERAQTILRQADPPNRERIDAQNAAINADWSAQVGRFEQRREQLIALQLQWEQYDNRVHAFENQVIRLEERAAHVDTLVRSRRQLEDTKHVIQVSVNRSFKPISRQLARSLIAMP